LLEVKLEYFKYLIKQKEKIKASPASASGQAHESQQTSEADNQEESKQQWRLPCMESIEEGIVSINSFCILIGAYLRQHSVSPKNVNV